MIPTGGKSKYLENNLYQSHFVNNKSHIDCPGMKPLLFYPEKAASTF